VQIIEMLLKVERMSLSDIAGELEKRGLGMSLSGVMKHAKELERAGILRSALADEPDARKTIYTLDGRERVKKIMKHLSEVASLLETGKIFCETERQPSKS
jgi:DNA-binding transcriptional ArsR family regulator